MKKTMVVVAVMAMVLSFGPAFGGDLQTAGGNKPYNGITYFDLGSGSTCAVASGISQEKTVVLSNGITVFDRGQESSTQRSCINLAANQAMSSKSYNGVTVF